MAVGLNTAHKVAKKVSEPRQCQRRDHLTKRTKFIGDKICKVSGFMACEKRVATHICAKRKWHQGPDPTPTAVKLVSRCLQ
uniref:Large ribosomal subunit protein eL36 n=1 Tax=Terrapene triunguis TaxID=2587831 RepID=A0A674KEK2_9SAUR